MMLFPGVVRYIGAKPAWLKAALELSLPRAIVDQLVLLPQQPAQSANQ